MLNISEVRINDKIDQSKYKAFQMLAGKNVSSALIKIMTIIGLLFILMLFMPWTQNVRSKGYVTTYSPYDRPQKIQALIGGKIVKWYVREGQYVNEGDTIIQISEVKEEYLDPQILDRTIGQIDAKSEAVKAYDSKAGNLGEQLEALLKSRDVKLEQNDIKIEQTLLYLQSDSIDWEAAKVKLKIAENQLTRNEELYREGLKSLTEVEAKRLSVQESNAKVVSLANKMNTHRNELENLRVNRIAIINDFGDKIAKSRSERMTAMSDMFDAQASVDKLQSQYNSYEVRQQNYFIKSPISGYVNKALQSGIGEILKNGDEIVSVVPKDYKLAVEMYVDPMDMPLLEIGQKVRIQFDGWPAIVFSGWPQNSYGTFGGEIFAIDNYISDNGKYRLLIQEAPDEQAWPKEIRIGGGANSIILLKNVSIGYELWRQMNGFPPDYYKTQGKEEDIKTKAPINKIK